MTASPKPRTAKRSKRILEENGVKVISVLEPISDNPEGIIMEGLAETMSEYYSANLSREVKKGFNVRALKCQNNGGRPPLGYMVDRETETFIINEDEAIIVRLIFDLYIKGYSYGYILNELNARGYKTRLDDYVLKMLEENIFDEHRFQKLIDGLKSSYNERLTNYSKEAQAFQERLPALDTRKQNIIKAISNGFIAEDFKEELSKIDLEREQIQLRLSEIHNNIPSMRLDEQKLSELLGEFREIVHSRNLSECKHFIREFVDCVIVSDSRIEIKLKISSSIINGCNFSITRAINRQFLPNPHKRTAD